MQVEVEILADDAHDQLTSLRQWLNAEDDLRGRVHRPAATVPPATMGAVADVLTVALAGGGALTVLVGSVSTWLQTGRGQDAVHDQRPDPRRHLVGAEPQRELPAVR